MAQWCIGLAVLWVALGVIVAAFHMCKKPKQAPIPWTVDRDGRIRTDKHQREVRMRARRHPPGAV